jgi:hypothetical protein
MDKPHLEVPATAMFVMKQVSRKVLAPFVISPYTQGSGHRTLRPVSVSFPVYAGNAMQALHTIATRVPKDTLALVLVTYANTAAQLMAPDTTKHFVFMRLIKYSTFRKTIHIKTVTSSLEQSP